MEKPMVSSKFSPDGGLLAIADGTNIVTVWDSCSSKQLCRITKSDWSTVKSLAWSHQKLQVGRKRKKRISVVDKGSPYLAVGGNHGVSLWDIKSDEELYATSMDDLGCVISISWSTDDCLFFCDGSPHVTQWNTAENTMDKLKCDKRCVCCVCANSDGTILITGGRTIKAWNISDHTLIKKFSGHISNITHITFLSSSLISTVAENDRTVCIWDTESDDSTTLVCDSSVNTVTSLLHRDQVEIATVCIEGLHMFSINSSVSKHTEPVSYSGTVKIKSKTNAQLLPILSAVLSSSGDIQLAHSSHIKPSFETIAFKQDDPLIHLERVVPKGLLLPDQKKPATTPSTVKKQSVPVIGTGTPMVKWGSVKDESNEGTLEDVPMSERLKALNINVKQENQKKKLFPTADSLSILVIQSVHSGDKRMLEDVLQASDEKLVNATVRNLPVTAVVPFLKTLVDLLQTNPARGPVLSLWIKSILLLHAAYLLTVPHLLNSMSTLYQSIESRTATYTKLNKLRGKLDLLLAQCSGVAGSNGLSHQIQLLNKPLISVTAGSDAHINESDDEFDVGLFQSSEEDNGDDEEDDHNESINSLSGSEPEDMEDD